MCSDGVCLCECVSVRQSIGAIHKYAGTVHSSYVFNNTNSSSAHVSFRQNANGARCYCSHSMKQISSTEKNSFFVFFHLQSANLPQVAAKNWISNVENCVIFELIVFFDVHFTEFHDNKVCHANGVSNSSSTPRITIYMKKKLYRGEYHINSIEAKQAQQQQHHWI